MFVQQPHNIWRTIRRTASRLRYDASGLSAVEFAVILPMVLTLLFGMIEVSNGVAADRKVTLTARALSDLISQAVSVTDTDIKNSHDASKGVMSPFDSSIVESVISEVKINASGQATIAWSKANEKAKAKEKTPGTVVTIPSSLAVPNTYLIWSEVSYTYKPLLPMPFMDWLIKKEGIVLSEQFFTRPRQSNCVLYNQSSCP